MSLFHSISFKNLRNFSVAILSLLFLSSSALHAELLSYWNFNNVSPAYNSGTLGSFNTSAAAYGEAYSQTSNSVPGTLASNTANSTVFNGTIDFANMAEISNVTINGKAASSYSSQESTTGDAGYGVFLDSTVNRAGTDATTGGSLIFLNSGINLDDQYITLSLSSVGYDALSLSYATRRTGGMSARDVWTYSTDGINYNALSTPGYTTGTGSFSTTNLDLSTLSANALDNQSSFYLRLKFDHNSGTVGSYSYDNIQVTGSVIPEPSSLLLLLVGGLGFACLRRKR